MNSGIYLIIAPSGKVYIGSTNMFSRRKTRHFGDLARGNHHCKGLQRAWNKYKGNLIFSIIEYCTQEQLLIREQWWLDNRLIFIHGIYNSDLIAGRTEQTEVTKAKISASKIGQGKSAETRAKMSVGMKGRVFSEKHRANLSRSHIGIKHTAESSEKKRLASIGRKRTDETKAKIANTMKGRIFSEETKRRMSDGAKRRNAAEKIYRELTLPA